MEFFNSAIDVLQTLVTAIGAGLAVSRIPLKQSENHPCGWFIFWRPRRDSNARPFA